MLAAVFLLTGYNMVAVLVEEVAVEPLCRIGSIRVRELLCRGEVPYFLGSRLQREVIEEGVAPVSLEFDSILAGFEVNDAGGGLLEIGSVGEGDFALIDVVDLKILHLLARVRGFAVRDVHLIESCLGDVYFDGNGRTLLVEVGKALARVVAEVRILGEILSFYAFYALGVDLASACFSVLKFILHNVLRICR